MSSGNIGDPGLGVGMTTTSTAAAVANAQLEAAIAAGAGGGGVGNNGGMSLWAIQQSLQMVPNSTPSQTSLLNMNMNLNGL